MALVLKDETLIFTSEGIAEMGLQGVFQPPFMYGDELIHHFIDSDGRLWQSTEIGVWLRINGPTAADLAASDNPPSHLRL